MHLTPDELIDVAEGTRSESSAPHLASCEPCRRHVADLRATMAAAADVDVPEPSPLFWDHLSDRVHAATAASSSPSGWNWWLRAAGPFALATAAAILVAVVATMRLMAPDAAPAPRSAFGAAPPAPVAPARETLNEVTDPSLAVVAALSDTLDWDEARDAGLAPSGSADHAVTHMSERELRELRDLLRQELANSGA